MRKINAIQAFLLIGLAAPISGAPERLRLGDFPTEHEIKEDERERRRRSQDAPVPSTASPVSVDQGAAPPVARPVEEASPVPVSVQPTKAPATPAAAPKPAVTNPTRAPKIAPRPAPKQVVSPEELRKQSDALYLQALSASQNGDFDAALTLCRKALRLDPSNLQAERMCERLETRKKQ